MNINILGVQEHRICHESSIEYHVIEGYQLITSSAWRNDAQAAVGGVGILLCETARNSLCSVQSTSPRVMCTTFSGNPATTIIVAYSPTNVAGVAEVEKFYDSLRAAIQDTPKHNFLSILGDFNARLGYEDVRFPYHANTNRNGEYLADLLSEYNLLAANTCFMKRPGKQWTFKDRSTGAKRQLDYILVRSKWRNSVLNAEAYNSFAGLGSDHRVVGMRVRLSLRVPKRPKRHPTYDWRKFAASPSMQSLYTIEVRNRFQALANGDDPSTLYQQFVMANEKAAKACVPKREKTRRASRSTHPDVVNAREKLKEALEAPSDEQEVGRARNSLFNVYDRLQEKDIEEKIEHVERAHDSSQYSEAWRIVNEISGRKKVTSGKISGNCPKERKDKWYNHFKSLLGNPPASGDDNQCPDIPAVLSDLHIEDGPFSAEEYNRAKNAIKLGKSAGPDNIPPKVLKCYELDDIILSFCNRALMDEGKPEQWSLANIIPIHKSGDPSSADNYRGISLTSIVAKTYNRMMLNRIRDPIDPYLRYNQNGFRQKRSTTSHILALRHILEEARRNNLTAVLVFLDFKKAFDSIDRTMMFRILKAYDIPPRLLNAIKAIHSGTRAKVVTEEGDTDEFEITTGVLQGDTLAPYLFVIVLDYALRKAIEGRESDLGFTLTPRKSRRHPAKALADLDFADDIVLLSDDIAQAQALLTLVERECLKIGLVSNTKKTEVIAINSPLTALQSVSGVPLKTVGDFKYLGSWIDNTSKDIKVRKAIAWKALNGMSVVWKSGLSRDLKIRFFRATVESILLYGSECWSLTISMEKSFDGTYTRMLRSVLDISWRDHVTNTILYGDLPRISDRIASRRLGFVGHCYRHRELPASQLVLWEPSHGWRKPGRPKASFLDTLKRDTGVATPAELSACMEDRKDWSQRCVARLRPPR